MTRFGQIKPYYFYRFLKWKLGDKSPLTAVAKITTKCNLKCKHCPWKDWDRKDISTKKWFRVLESARKKGAIHLVIEGGEPTLRDDLNDIISYAKNLGMLVMVITNGTNDLTQYDPDNYWISVDGLQDTHNQQRGADVFEDIVDNVKRIPEKSKIIGCTISKLNQNQVEDFASYFSPIADYVWYNFMYPYSGVEDISLNKLEKKRISRKILDLKEKYPNILNSKSYLKDVGNLFKCYPFLTLLIEPDGSFHQGCTIEQLEECDCEKCDLACYSELSHAMKLKKDSIEFLKKTTGFTNENIFKLYQ